VVFSPLLPAWVGAVFFALASVLLIAVVHRLSAMHPADERLIRGAW
jgi:membrane protein implicated in regulation of membrane protease activity